MLSAGEDLLRFAGARRFSTVLADPPWQFTNKTGKVAPEHKRLSRYGTMKLDEIMALPVADIAAPTSHLYLWCPNAMLPDGLAVLKAWGFTYKTHMAWDKEIVGTGYWLRNQHELLLIGTRGNVPAPADGTQWSSVLRERRTEHSVKPVGAYEMIESYFPNVPKIELNARKARKGWSVWGFEAPTTEVAE